MADSDEHQVFAGLSADQPLLRGATGGSPRAAIRAARQNRFIAFHQYRKQLSETIIMAEAAYWNLAFAQERLEMAEESFEIAQALERDMRASVRAGRASEIDLLEAETQLAIRESRLADARQTLRDAMTRVRLMVSPEFAPAGRPLQTAQRITSPGLDGWDAEQQAERAMDWAFRAQPDYMISREQLERQRIALGFWKDRTLPELNLSGSYGYSGVGSSNDEAMDDLFARRYPSWEIGLELRVPLLLGEREEKELNVAQIETGIAVKRVQALEQELSGAIALLVGRVETLVARIENAGKQVEFQRRLLDVAQQRMEAGRGDIHNVYEAEEDLADARDQELETAVLLREALLELSSVGGSVLRDRGLERLEGSQVVLSEGVLYVEP